MLSVVYMVRQPVLLNKCCERNITGCFILCLIFAGAAVFVCCTCPLSLAYRSPAPLIALSVIPSGCHLSQRERPWQAGERIRTEQSFFITQNTGPCCPDQRFHTVNPDRRARLLYAKLHFVRFAQSLPICQGLTGLRLSASASCLERHSCPAGRCPNSSSLFPPLAEMHSCRDSLRHGVAVPAPSKREPFVKLTLFANGSLREGA